MRMWMVEPVIMCRKHLMGEHLETHMFAGTARQEKCLDGYVISNCLEFNAIRERHDALANEMVRRGYKHDSPMPTMCNRNYCDEILNSKVDVVKAKAELMARCEECRKRSVEHGKM